MKNSSERNMNPKEFKKWFEKHKAEIEKEIEYKGLIGGLYYAYLAGVSGE
jgi:hypothetical protein